MFCFPFCPKLDLYYSKCFQKPLMHIGFILGIIVEFKCSSPDKKTKKKKLLVLKYTGTVVFYKGRSEDAKGFYKLLVKCGFCFCYTYSLLCL